MSDRLAWGGKGQRMRNVTLAFLILATSLACGYLFGLWADNRFGACLVTLGVHNTLLLVLEDR